MTILPLLWIFFGYYFQHRSMSKSQLERRDGDQLEKRDGDRLQHRSMSKSQLERRDGDQLEKRDGDRLSGLPDDILLHILSFLATDEVVCTSLLSTRWRRIWTSVPVLLFDSRRFDQNDKFVRFVDNVIACRNETRIDLFMLMWHESLDEHKATAWTSYASDRSVRELVLDVRPGQECRLPIGVLSGCPSLERCCLELPKDIWYDRPAGLVTFNPTNLHLPSSANLAKLRVLQLHYVMTADKLLGKLISDCPVLEDLSIHIDQDIEISAPNLKVLKLYTTSLSDASTARIFVPRLERLTCNLHGHPAILLDGLRCPVYANIYVGERKIENMNNLVTLLRSLRLAKALTLDGRFVEALSKVQGLSTQMKFNDLKYLEVKAPLDSNNAKTIFMLLEGCPNLEKIVVYNTKECNQLATAEHQRDWIHHGPKYSCNLSKLKEITVNYFLGDDDDELEFMNSLLRSTTCLQKIRTKYKDVSFYGRNHTWAAPKLEFMIRAPSTAKVISGYY